MIADIRFGDCLKLFNEIPDGSVHLVATDPPYSINYISNRRKYESDIVRPVENDLKWNPVWFEDVIRQCHRVLADNTHIYVFCSDEHLGETQEIISRHFVFKNVLVWDKANWTAGDLEGQYGKQAEFIIFAQKGRRALNRRPPSIISIPKIHHGDLVHSCQKPVSLMGFLIENSTKEGEVVFDPFVGSGSTALAAIGLNRKFIGFEIDRKTYDIAIMRLNGDVEQGKLF